MRDGVQLRVLLVENDDASAELLEEELAAWGCHVTSTPLDHRGLVLAVHHRFDAIAVSLDLGGSGGASLLDCLALTAPDARLIALQAREDAPVGSVRMPLARVPLVRRPTAENPLTSAAIEILAAALEATVAR